MISRIFSYFHNSNDTNEEEVGLLSDVQDSVTVDIDRIKQLPNTNQSTKKITALESTPVLIEKMESAQKQIEKLKDNLESLEDRVEAAKDQVIAINNCLEFLKETNPGFLLRHPVMITLLTLSLIGTGVAVKYFVDGITWSSEDEKGAVAELDHSMIPGWSQNCGYYISDVTDICAVSYIAFEPYSSCYQIARRLCDQLTTNNKIQIISTFAGGLGGVVANIFTGINLYFDYQSYKINPFFDKRSYQQLSEEENNKLRDLLFQINSNEMYDQLIASLSGGSDADVSACKKIDKLKEQLIKDRNSHEYSIISLDKKIKKDKVQIAVYEEEYDSAHNQLNAKQLYANNRSLFYAVNKKNPESDVKVLPREIVNQIWDYVKPADFIDLPKVTQRLGK